MEAWKRLKFLHAADLQLDSPFAGLEQVPETMRTQLRDSTFAALERLVELAIAEQADFVVIAGDTFETADRSLRAQLCLQKAARKLASYGIGLFVAMGDRDPADGMRTKLNWPETTHFFAADKAECVPVVVPERGLIAYVCGMSHASSSASGNWASHFSRADSSTFHVGVLHANVADQPEDGECATCGLNDLLATGIDYWALGHAHAPRVLAERPAVVYAGTPQALHVRETGARGCYVVEVAGASGNPLSLQFHALDSIRCFERHIPIEGLESEQQLQEAFAAALSEIRTEADGRHALVRFVLTGRGALHPVIQREGAEWLTQLREDAAAGAEQQVGSGQVYVESLQTETGLAPNGRRLAEEDGFVGDLARLGEQLLQDDEMFEAFCADALAPLLQHAKMNAVAAGISGDERRRWLRSSIELALEQVSEL